MKAKKILFALTFCIGTHELFSMGHISTQSHTGRINDIQPIYSMRDVNASFYTAGNDGFIIKWNKNGTGEHYQVSNLQVKMITRNPQTDDIAVYETDGTTMHKVTVFNSKCEKVFSKKFTDSISALAYSSRGKYLIIGMNAINGTFILDAKTGNVSKRPNDIPGIVGMVQTGESEKTAVFYLKSGAIVYYSLTGMKQKAKFVTVPNLTQPMLVGEGKMKNRFLAGIRDNFIYIIDATSGRTLTQFTANKPFIITSAGSSEEKQGLYFVTDNGKTHALSLVDNSMLETLLHGNTAIEPKHLKNFTGLNGGESFTCASKNAENIILSTQQGNVYTMTDIPESEMYSLFALTETIYEKINDIASQKNEFYVLTQNAIFKTAYETKLADRLASNPSQTNIMLYENDAILWSRGTKKAVQKVSLDKTDSRTPLFSPKTELRALKACGTKLVYVMGTSTVGLYDMEKQANVEIYKGTSIQDAVLIDDKTLFVAKTSTGANDSAIILVNIQTQETLPLKFQANVAFSLSYNYTEENSQLYGISIATTNKNAKTEMFTMNPQTRVFSSLFRFQEEDNAAFTVSEQPNVYTNIGKNQIRECNTKTRKITVFKRSASMPVKVAASKEKIAVLNSNGSISWFNPNSQEILSDWYYTVEGEWMEF